MLANLRDIVRRVADDMRGFTLVELTVALFTSGIVMAGMYVIVSSSHTYILRSRDRVRLQQDFSLTELLVAKYIRPSIRGNHKIYTSYAAYTSGHSPQSSGSCLKLQYPSGDSALLYHDGKSLTVVDTTQSVTSLVQDVVESLDFTSQASTIQTAILLTRDRWRIAGTLVDTFRNFVANRETTNVALNAPATQSSTRYGGLPTRAVDGNTNGDYFINSVSHTAYERTGWWQVDLGASKTITTIDVWNRSDCCADRLRRFHVFVSDSPFSSYNLTATQNQTGVSDYYISGHAGYPTSITVGRSVRYVRVQLARRNYLSLAEVEIWGY